jgi:3'-phosphoadenosine 5'-phosphosulfate sulfotransferase (PAPS reductase)/FAD synthetase
MTLQVVAFSGGKDSTTLALRMAELGENFELLFTPTGNELPELEAHIDAIVGRVDRPLILPPNRSLAQWIEHYKALPNWRQRWCTRQIKIVPCIAYLKAHPGSVLCVGLRADEMAREGLYGDYASYRYPLREWGWGIADVQRYLSEKNITVPARTDCAVCPYQRLGEWWALWKEHPEHFAQGERWEAETGHTFRSRGRDTWPAALADLRKRFEAGEVPRGRGRSLLQAEEACRVCRF